MTDGASAPKEDVAHFELRATAPRPVRVRRGALIGVSACVVALVSGTVMLALRTPAPMTASGANDGRPADPAAANETLASAPASYAKVPVLGPPLKGIEMLTGRPSPSDATQLPVAADNGPGGNGGAGPVASDPKAGEIERSPVLVSLGARQTGSSGSDGSAVSASRLSPGASLPLAPVSANDKPEQAPGLSDEPNLQGHKAAFLHASEQSDGVNPHILIPAASPWIVSAGSIIAASLITGIDSDLPGEVTAQVTENVYDSPTGQTLLIPQGARLIGGSDNVVSYGQKRALIVWRRLILPDGASIQLDNWPGADKSGYTGLADSVDGHSWQLIKGVALSTLLGIGSELSYGSSDSDLARALRQSIETGTDRAGQQLVGKSLDIKPTIRVRPGWPVRVVVHQDLVLQPWLSRSQMRVP